MTTSNPANIELSRRTVLQTGVAAMAAAGIAPFVRAAPRWDPKNPVIGTGEHQYECIHDWAVLPGTHAFGNTHGIAFDSKGNCHIKHTVNASSSSADAICVFDPSGKFVRSWGAEYRGGAHGLTLSKEKDGEFLWLADCNRSVVQKTTLEGKVVIDLAWPEASGLYNNKGEYKPTNIAVVPSGPRAGTFYVADGYGKSWIHEYNPKGEYQRSFGGPGNNRGQVSCPHGIGIDMRGNEPTIVVADRSNRRLQYFTLDGRHINFVTAELRSPCHFDFRGDLILIPDLEARVTLFNKKNELVAQLGDGTNFGLRDKPRDQFIPGKFIAPHSAIFDRDGNIFVVEWVEVGRVTKLRRVS